VCESEKCSNNGHCWVKGKNNEVICKCYEDYSGEQCETANVMSKIIKYVRVSSLTLFLCTIGTFVFLIVANDVANLFCKTSRKKKEDKEKKRRESTESITYKYIYHND
jgi:hypothetical protein